MTYHPVVDQIIQILQAQNYWYEKFEHGEVKTSEEAAAVRPDYSLAQGAKALIVKADDKFVMLVIPGDKKFSNSKVKKLMDVGDVRFATEEQVNQITSGIKIGGVPPFGNLFGLQVIADPTLFINEKIIFNAGDRCVSVAMKSEDYKKLILPIIGDIIA